MDTENKYGTLNAQMGLLELLKEFHAFCVQNDIRYSLAYGSLLGAIRHKGFIPWDDDLDVFMDRNNYNKLAQMIEHSRDLQVERDSVDSLWVDRVRRKQTEPNGKYQPTLDILLLDNVPEAPLKRKAKLLLVLMLQGMIKPSPSFDKGSVVLKICSVATFVMGKLLPIKWKKSWYRKISQIGNSKPSKQVANYNGEFADLRRCYPSDMMEHIVECDFEDTRAYIVKDYDMCLTTQFGDYMTPPQESERKPAHGGGILFI